MKKIFLVLCIAAFSFASAQENGKPYLRIVPRKSEINTFRVPPIVSPPTQALPNMKLLFTLPDSNKVYILPQDNMRCIVPDMSQYNMPVIRPDMSQYNMPNAAVPSPNKSLAITPEKLQELLKDKNVIFK